MKIVVGGLLLAAGVVCFAAATWFAGRMRRRDDAKADPRRNLDWSQNLDTGIFRFLGVCVGVVGVLILTGVIPL